MLLDVSEAQRRVLAAINLAPVVELPLSDAFGRTLAVDVATDIDDPPFDRSVMDGWAIRASDAIQAPSRLAIVGEVSAGRQFHGTVGAGQAALINTGAPLPAGADAVVRVEDSQCDRETRTVCTLTSARSGQNVTPRGTHARAGQIVLSSGTLLGPPQAAVAAAAGAARVKVYAPARVAILVTGDELVDVGQMPGPAQIRNANGYALMALVRQAGAEAVPLGIARDDDTELERCIRAGLACDVLVVTGGVSMGTLDLVPGVLERCGVEVRFHKMALKPGKPTLFGVAKTEQRPCAVFALPGNPVSALVAFWLLVRPALAAREGRPAVPDPVLARLDGAVKATGDRQSYLPARITVAADGKLRVTPLRWHGSGDVFGMAAANALIMRPPHAPPAVADERVAVLVLSHAGP